MTRFELPQDSPLAEVLQQQEGVATAEQLQQAGVTPGVMQARVVAHRWQRPHHGVYAIFSGSLPRLAVIWAAILRCGPGAVASHATAAELYDLDVRRDQRVHVTIDASRRVRGRLDGIVIHHTYRLDQTKHPVLLPPRTRLDDTVLDLVNSAGSAREATEGVLSAIQRRLTTPARLSSALGDRKKIRWRALLEAMLADTADGAQSVLEIEHLRSVERAHGLPAGTRQHRVGGQRVIWVDISYDEYDTRVELDGRAGHAGEGAFRDRRRDNHGTVSQYWTLRYGYAEVFGTPCEVAAEQALVLQQRGWLGTPRPCGPNCSVATAMRAQISGNQSQDIAS